MTDELEWQTRRDRINKKLKALKPSWKIIKYSEKLNTQSLKRYAVEEYPHDQKASIMITEYHPDPRRWIDGKIG